MAASAEVKFCEWAPDMSLYHSIDSHYDLLVSDNSRLALMGLLGRTSGNDFEELGDEWKTVKPKRQFSRKKNTQEKNF